MNGFAQLLYGLPAFQQMKTALETRQTPVLATGLPNVHKAHLILALTQATGLPGIVVVADEATASRMCEDLNLMAGQEGAAVLFPSREFTFQEVQGVSREYEHARLSVLGKLAGGSAKLVVASAQAALQYTMPPQALARRIRRLRAGESYDLEELCAFLLSAGYARADQVEGVCQFSRRGGILDFFPPHMPDPFRVEFWGDEVDTISTFKIETQRRVDTVKWVDITPAAEVVVDSLPQLERLLKAARAKLRGTQGKRAKEQIDQVLEQLEAGVVPNLSRAGHPLRLSTPGGALPL